MYNPVEKFVLVSAYMFKSTRLGFTINKIIMFLNPRGKHEEASFELLNYIYIKKNTSKQSVLQTKGEKKIL